MFLPFTERYNNNLCVNDGIICVCDDSQQLAVGS